MTRDWFEKLTYFVPPALRADAVVAGGYAVDPQLATDIDVFILQPQWSFKGIPMKWDKERTIEGDIDLILKYLDDNDFSYEPNEHEPYGHQRQLVATIEGAYEGKALQIISTSFPTAQALVDSFDLSVHMMAKRPSESSHGRVMRVTFGKKWTSLRDPMRVTRWDTPRETLARAEKLSKRYGLRVHDLDLTQLENAAIAAEVRAAGRKAA